MFHKCLIKSLLASLGMSQPLRHMENIQEDKDISKKKKTPGGIVYSILSYPGEL